MRRTRCPPTGHDHGQIYILTCVFYQILFPLVKKINYSYLYYVKQIMVRNSVLHLVPDGGFSYMNGNDWIDNFFEVLYFMLEWLKHIYFNAFPSVSVTTYVSWKGISFTLTADGFLTSGSPMTWSKHGPEVDLRVCTKWRPKKAVERGGYVACSKRWI